MADIIRKTVTQKMYGWSKWGGANMGLLVDPDQQEWCCQACGERHTRDLPSYLIPFDGTMREFCRVCSRCKNRAIKAQIDNVFALINAVRRRSTVFTDLLENL